MSQTMITKNKIFQTVSNIIPITDPHKTFLTHKDSYKITDQISTNFLKYTKEKRQIKGLDQIDYMLKPHENQISYILASHEHLDIPEIYQISKQASKISEIFAIFYHEQETIKK